MTADAPRARRYRASRLTVQGWQYLVLGIMGALVLTGAVAGWLLLNRTDDISARLKNDIQPARVAAYQLQAALRDQESAVRSYALTAEPEFLAPYDEARRAEQVAIADIRRLVGDYPDLIADAEAIERMAVDWRQGYVAPLIESVRPAQPRLVDRTAVDRERAEFERLRALFDDQNEDLTATRQAAVDHLDTIRSWRDVTLTAMVTVFLLTGILLAVLMRRAVTRPLAGLAAACRRITEGNFGEKIVVGGPKDIRGIATDVEDMRQHIVDELEASRSAREQLTHQAAALDEQADELRRSNAELEQFAYVASHDLQEPLRKVASFCQLLERRYADKLDERGVEYIGFAVDGAKRMQGLINDLLTFSRVGRLNVDQTAIDLDATLDTAVANLAIAVDESGTEIVRPRDMPEVVGDPTLLTMLWQNLIGNAIKFRHADRPPRVVIECGTDAEHHEDKWVFCVSDNGIGIDDDFVDKVFVIFQRLHRRETYSGTGIGLALCKKIVEHHGGNIWIDTAYTDGTRFCFTMPVLLSEAPSAVLEGAQE